MSAMLPSYEHQNGGLRDDQVRLALECDFDRGFAEEQRVIARFCLRRQVPHLRTPAVDLPRLLVHARGLRHGRPGSGGDDPPALHLPSFDGRRGQIEADVGPLLALLGNDEHTVANDDQALRVVHHTEMSSPVWEFYASRRGPVMLVTLLLLDLSGPVYNNVPASMPTPSSSLGGLRRCCKNPRQHRLSSGVSSSSSSCSGWSLGWRGSFR